MSGGATGDDGDSGSAGATATGGTGANTAGSGGTALHLICPDPKPVSGSNVLIDTRDGQKYPTIMVGSQTWMARNLNIGQIVPGIREHPGLSDDSKVEKFCFDDLPENCTRCGGLYTWAEAMGLPKACVSQDCSAQIQSVHQGICPSGWHVPRQSEWTTLAAALAEQTGFLTIEPGTSECRPDLGTAMKSTSSWDANGNGTNTTGFDAVPAGWRNGDGGFYSGGGMAAFISATWDPVSRPDWVRTLSSSTTRFCMSNPLHDHSFSIRCVKD